MRRGRLRTLVIAMTAIASAMAVSVSGVLAQSRDAAPRAVAAGAIAVTGNVQQPLRLSVADLAAMPDQQTVNATFAAGGAPETHVFTGPRLRATCSLARCRGSIRPSRTTSCATTPPSRRPTATRRSWATASSTRASRASRSCWP
jgi:hypothetical protein